ncbi:delta(14)-sterol reductase TM7SF2-like [Amphibalanus amphitrite]|uniref:delta(14)-sterol reductase TM7SF2-like n=1 Tax=Amphibalanus amphitrite TaxID=1232801 RepID=UPI001C902E0C|nr:delta(14)-sterol reductase TM7SF2-like [Amphibalanus amphitrite]
MPRSRTPSRSRQARGSRSRSRGRKSPARASRSPGRVGGASRSPARVSKSPARASAPASRSSQSPPTRQRVTRSRSPARVAAAAQKAVPNSVTPPPAESAAPSAELLTSTPKSEVRARRPLTRTAPVPVEVASPPPVNNANSNSKPAPEEEEKEKAPEPSPSGVTTRHSARIANKLRELGIDPAAGGDTAREPSPAAAEEDLKPKRDTHVGWGRALLTPMVLGIALLPLYVYSACNKKHCSIRRVPEVPTALKAWFDPVAFACVLGFLAVQVAISLLPVGREVEGQISKQGIRRYRCNGFLSLVLTVGGVVLAYYLDAPVMVALLKLRLLMVASAVTALLLAPLLHWRARSAHLLDLNSSGDTDSLLVNVSEGRELAPRLLGLDMKLLMTRACCVAAVLLAVLFVLAERGLKGESSPTLVTAAVMVAAIGVDHMWFEDTLLTTYTFMNEGFGLKKLLGAMMMPFCMTFNLRFIMVTGVSHPWYALVGCVMIYLVGYLIQRSANSQKNEFRKNPVNPALAHLETIPTTKGKKLLVSGWWGVVRHPNHLGGVLMIVAMSLLLGFHHALGWVLPACAALGVVMQARKVDAFCQQKYGAAWERYAARVRYRLIPSVF